MKQFISVLPHRKKIVLIIILSSLIAFLYSYNRNNSIMALQKLGYDEKETQEIVTADNLFVVVSKEEEALNKKIDGLYDDLALLGVTKDSITLKEGPLLAKYEQLNVLKIERNKYLDNQIDVLVNKLQSYQIAYENTTKTKVEKIAYLETLLNNHYQNTINNYVAILNGLGYGEQALLLLNNFQGESALSELQSLHEQALLQEEALLNVFGGNQELKDQIMRMFNETNAYRQSLGLKPYVYNYDKQECTYNEALAYSNNNNPHNWVCPNANENAAISSYNSDYVTIAMNFFKSDPPHEAVLSGNYNSVSISFVLRNNTVYMIMSVFY
ncbi:MAG: hypothetical protein ACRCTA_07555 [Bacilli bacterium]